MKLTLNVDSAGMLIRAKQNSNLNFNQLIKEAMELLLLKYNDNYKTKDQNDQTKTSRTT